MRSTTLAIVVTAFLMFPVLSFGEGAIPDLKGKWVGQTEGIKYGKGDPKGHRNESKPGEVTRLEFTMSFEFQEGRVFSGTRSSKRNSERFIGVIRSDNKTIYIIDEDGYISGHLLSKNKMELIYREVMHPVQVVHIGIFERKQ
jgi:hypothetical protein